MDTKAQAPAILAGLFKDLAWVRVVGKGTFLTSPQMKAFAQRMVEMGQRNLVVDLEECPVMDSTFMGTLTGIALKLSPENKGCLQIINSNPRNVTALQSLGLDRLLELDLDGDVWAKERDLVRKNITQEFDEGRLEKSESKQHVLDAHVALCQANADNEAKFRDVIDFLKQDIPDEREGDSEAQS